jgi:hypothetical protein
MLWWCVCLGRFGEALGLGGDGAGVVVAVVVAVVVSAWCWARRIVRWEASRRVREVARIQEVDLDLDLDLDLVGSVTAVMREMWLRAGRRGMLCVSRRL